jgi:hypothetical protein
MPATTVFRPEAQADLLQTRDWYEQQRPGLGDLFSLAMEEAVSRIEAMPQMYRLFSAKCVAVSCELSPT